MFRRPTKKGNIRGRSSTICVMVRALFTTRKAASTLDNGNKTKWAAKEFSITQTTKSHMKVTGRRTNFTATAFSIISKYNHFKKASTIRTGKMSRSFGLNMKGSLIMIIKTVKANGTSQMGKFCKLRSIRIW